VSLKAMVNYVPTTLLVLGPQKRVNCLAFVNETQEKVDGSINLNGVDLSIRRDG
jgi:hypothetical protein